jgi:hypothetical protein
LGQQDGRALQPTDAQIAERLVRTLERIGLHFGDALRQVAATIKAADPRATAARQR